MQPSADFSPAPRKLGVIEAKLATVLTGLIVNYEQHKTPDLPASIDFVGSLSQSPGFLKVLPLFSSIQQLLSHFPFFASSFTEKIEIIRNKFPHIPTMRITCTHFVCLLSY